MNFNFNEVSEVKTSTALQANNIYDVEFLGIDITEDVKLAAGGTGTVLDIKFAEINKAGNYTHRVFPLSKEDAEEKDNQFGGKNPSRLKQTMQLFKFIIKEVNPTLFDQIQAGEKPFGANTWEGICKFMVAATKDGIGTKTQIKLVANNKGFSTLPQYPLAYSKDGSLYVTSYFIGKKLYFTDKEQKAAAIQKSAKPTAQTDEFGLNSTSQTSNQNNSDLDFNL